MNAYHWHPWFFFWERRLVGGALAPVDDPAGIGLAGDLADGRWEYRWLHRYIRTGDALTTYNHDGRGSAETFQHVKVEGWGKYAPVRHGVIRTIRRDEIHKDANGNWFYRYDD